MADLTTTYMGIQLKNPLILGACPMVEHPKLIKRIADEGIGAVIYRSLFEEQIGLEAIQLEDQLTEYDERSAEMQKIFPNIEHAGAAEHIFKVAQLVKATSVPIIASINCVNPETWVEYAIKLEKVGAAGLELNFYYVPLSIHDEGTQIEERQLKILKDVKQAVEIPVSVKLSPFYTNPLQFVKKLDEAEADGVVLFNRFFQPEINIEKEKFYFPFNLSRTQDYHVTLRYVGLLHGNLMNTSLCASRGIMNGKDVIKMILAGAETVQMVSTVYKHHPTIIQEILVMLSHWMDTQGYTSLADFRGKLSYQNINDPKAYERAQYVDILMKPTEIINKYPLK